MSKQHSCHDEMLTLYHYDELTEDQRHELELHLHSCPPCRTALAEIEASLAALPPFELKLTAAQKRRFVEKVTQPIPRRSIRSIGSWGGGLAAAGMVAVVILLMLPADQKSLVAPVVPATPVMADFEMLEQLELLQDLDLLQNLELLQDLEKLG